MKYSVQELKSLLNLTSHIPIPSAHVQPFGQSSFPRTVLLTGATGWLGSHIVHSLLRAYHLHPLTLVCPVRAQDTKSAQHKLSGAWSSHAILSEITWPHPKIHVLPIGDLSQGLPSWDGPIDAIIHGAADMSLALDLHKAWSSNVRATQNVWTWGRQHGCNRFHHVSTLSVFVASDKAPGLVQEHDALETSSHLYGGYAASKWCAEAWLLSQSPSCNLAIHRPGLLSHSVTNGWAPHDGIWAWASAWKKWGKEQFIPHPSFARRPKVDWTCPAFVAQGIVDSLLGDAVGVYHWARPHAVPASVWIEEMQTVFGDQMGAWPQNDVLGKSARRAVGRFSNPLRAQTWWWHDVFQSTHHQYGSSNAASILPCAPWTREQLRSALHNI